MAYLVKTNVRKQIYEVDHFCLVSKNIKYFLVAHVIWNSISSEDLLAFVVENSDSLVYKHTEYSAHVAT